MNVILERSKRFCGYLVGIVFFISGVFKLMDPVGTGLIVSEYYKFMHLEFLDFSSGIAAVTLSMAESLVGAALITGLWRRVVAIVTMCMTGVFLLVSVALVVFNPVMDCGCFGEAIHLTHLQTLVKNLVLSLLCCASFFPFSALGQPKKRKYVAFSLVAAGLLFFMIYSLLYIPVKDFTGYSASARLAASERHIEGALADTEEYEAVFVYEKDGKKEEFTLENLPDSTWTFVSAETVRKERHRPEESIVTLPVIDADGGYHDYLAATGNAMVVSVYAPGKLSLRKWKVVHDYLVSAGDNGFRPLLLVAASPEAGQEIKDTMAASGDFDMDFIGDAMYFSDYKTLISLNRSNGGATFFYDGFLVRKWSFRSLPGPGRLSELGAEDPAESLLAYSTVGNLFFQAFFLFSFAVMLLL